MQKHLCSPKVTNLQAQFDLIHAESIQKESHCVDILDMYYRLEIYLDDLSLIT